MRTFKNETKGLIVVNYKDGDKNRKVAHIAGGASIDNEFITDKDVKFYTDKKKIKVTKVEAKKADTKKAPVEPVVLPENPTAENLKPLLVKDLRRYCKENEIKIPANTDEDGVIELILNSLEPKE